MPRYDYRCSTCQKTETVTRKMSAEDMTIGRVCHHCEAGRWQRIFHAAPISFKGKGFYRTDSA